MVFIIAGVISLTCAIIVRQRNDMRRYRFLVTLSYANFAAGYLSKTQNILSLRFILPIAIGFALLYIYLIFNKKEEAKRSLKINEVLDAKHLWIKENRYKFSPKATSEINNVMSSLASEYISLEDKTLSMLINEWHLVVIEVKKGYQLTIDDYNNDLINRETIEEVLDKVSAETREAIQEILEPLDREFINCTTEGKQASTLFEPKPKWLNRIPIKYSEEFKSDLISLNII